MNNDTIERISQELTLQLLQLITLVHEHDLLSRSSTETLIDLGLCSNFSKWYTITGKGIEYLCDADLLE